MTPLDYALRYIARGWPVFPVHTVIDGRCSCGKHPCRDAGKHPVWDAAPNGFKDATTDEATVRRWWAKYPEANIGIPTGQPSGFWVLDIDPRHGGHISLDAMQMDWSVFPDSLRARTGSGGAHILFAMPTDRDVRNDVGMEPGIDVRGTGGYIVAAPSRHASGGVYTWEDEDAEIEEAPGWLLSLMAEPRAPGSRVESKLPEGVKNGRGYAKTALDRECDELTSMPAGSGRNNKINRIAFRMRPLIEAGWISRAAVEDALQSGAEQAGHAAARARKTIASGLGDVREPPEEAPKSEHHPAVLATGAGPWASRLLYTKDERIRPTPGNALLIAEHAEGLAGVFAYDELAARVMVVRDPPWAGEARPRALSDEDAHWAAQWIEQRFSVAFSVEMVGRSIVTAASRRRFDPLREYLSGLSWDGVERLPYMLSNYFGVEASDYAYAVGRKWMISAVARALKPGCKADHVLVLEGEQGLLKSSGLAVLGGAWFTDQMPDLDTKDSSQAVSGAWIIELGELGAIRRVDTEKVKAFLTRTTERYRPPYGRNLVEYQRRCVFAATTNAAHYLHDDTGNRRFWPVACAQPVDVDGLSEVRDQLWAEAVRAYKQGHPWWFTPAEAALSWEAATAQEARREVDPWEPLIATWARQRSSIRVEEVFEMLGVRDRDMKRGDSMRIGAVLRTLGYERRRRMVEGDRHYHYVRAAASPALLQPYQSGGGRADASH